MSAMEWSAVLGTLARGDDLSRQTAQAAMSRIMDGEATPAQMAAFIVALRIKGESIEEMTGLVASMRQASVQVEVGVDVVDIVGTGGDGAGTFNISTTAALVAAGAGAKVAKHGNRSASSKCGSADVLEALGVAIDLAPADTVTLIEPEGFGFFFARCVTPGRFGPNSASRRSSISSDPSRIQPERAIRRSGCRTPTWRPR